MKKRFGFTANRLGEPATERVGDAELLISTNEERRGLFHRRASDDGTETIVAVALKPGLRVAPRGVDAFQRASRLASSAPAFAVTYTNDTSPARAFISAIAAQRGARVQATNNVELERASTVDICCQPTRLIEGGFDKKTHSSFGQFVTLAAQFAKYVESNQ